MCLDRVHVHYYITVIILVSKETPFASSGTHSVPDCCAVCDSVSSAKCYCSVTYGRSGDIGNDRMGASQIEAAIRDSQYLGLSYL
jgi:hypothetical protein